MAKRWRKQKASQQQSRRRKPMGQGSGDASHARGTIGGMRRFVGGKLIDVLLWVAAGVVAAIFLGRQCAG